MKLRAYLFLLVAVALLPALIFSVFMLTAQQSQEFATLERGMRDTARALTTALDGEFIASIRALKVLAASNTLDERQLAEFYGEMKRSLAAYGPTWQNITLSDRTGQHLINLRLPFGSRLPRRAPEPAEQDLRTKEAFVSDLFPGPVTGAPSMVVTVPVLKDGEVKYLLRAGFAPARLSELLTQQKLPPGWIATIIDRNGLTAARSERIEEFLGKPAPQLASATARAEEGFVETVTRDKTSVYIAFSISRLSGWTVALGVPTQLFDAPVRRSLLITAASGVLLLLFGGLFAAIISRRITFSATALSAGARALGKREAPRVGTFGVAELDEVAHEIETAAVKRQQAEEALRESEERFRALIEHSHDAIALFGADGAVLYASPSTTNILGYLPEELCQRSMLEFVRPDWQDTARERLAESLHRPGVGIPTEGYVRNKNGEYRFLEGVFTNLLDEPSVGAIVNNYRDITERKQAEERVREHLAETQRARTALLNLLEDHKRSAVALRESEERFRAIASKTPDLILVQDRDLRYQWIVNPQLGLTEKDMIGKTDLDIRGKEDAEKLTAIKRKVLETGEPVQLETSLQNSKGETVFFEGTYVPKFDATGKADGLIGYFRNVTERKRAEAALWESEERHRMILRTAMDGFWLVDMQGRLLEVNETYCEMSGYSEQELLALSISDLEAAETPTETAVHFQRVAAQGEDRFESRHRRKDGSSFAVEISVQYRPADGGQRVAFLRDITDRKQAEEVLRRNEASLEDAQQRARLGSWELDLKSGHRNWSKELFRIYHRDPALGVPSLDDFLALVHPEDLASIRDAHKLAECTDQPISLAFRTNPADGPILYLDATIHSVRDARGECVQLAGTVLDITERKQAEDALRAQNMELQILHETSQTILASRNIQNMAASILEKALAVSHCDLGVIRLLDRTSMTLDPIASHGYRNPKNLQQHRRHLDDGTTGRLLQTFARKETVVLERVQDQPGLPIFKSEGVQSLILIPVLAEHDLLGALQLGSRTPRKFDPHLINLLETLGSNFGIAVQKNRLLEETLASQAQLRALSLRLVNAQEIERRDLARELHDEIGSLLTGLKLTLGGSAASGTDQIDARTAAAHAIIDEALAKTRSLSHSLRPPMLDDLGLLAALSWHVKEFTARTGVEVDFEHYGLERRFPTEVEIAAYRIVQEALTNIARHAQVKKAAVTLWADQSGLGVEISDRGAGFEQTATLANASGMGFAGIRERVASLGGSLTITSAPGTGTNVTVELPLATGEKTVRSER